MTYWINGGKNTRHLLHRRGGKIKKVSKRKEGIGAKSKNLAQKMRLERTYKDVLIRLVESNSTLGGGGKREKGDLYWIVDPEKKK